MANKIRYQFRLKWEDPIATFNDIELNACYGDDFTIDYQEETGERFFRRFLNDGIILSKEEFDIIDQTPFDTEFTLEIHEALDGQNFQIFWKGIFFKTDIKFDNDDFNLKVQPDVVDQYKTLMEGMDREFDLIKLAPDLQEIDMIKRPILQIYALGMSVITNVMGSNFSVDSINGGPYFTADIPQLENDFHFFDYGFYVNVPPGTYTEPNIEGTYWSLPNIPASVSKPHIKVDTQDYYFDREPLAGNNWRFRLRRFSDNVILFHSTTISGLPGPESWSGLLFTDIATGLETFYSTGYGVFARYITTLDTYDTVSTVDIPSDDIVFPIQNYTKVTPAILGTGFPHFVLNSNIKTTPDGVGKYPDDCPAPFTGNYYEKTTILDVNPDIGAGTKIPLGKSNWLCATLYFNTSTSGIQAKELQNVDPFTLRDSYTLDSVINVLIREIDPTIDFQANDSYSEFLYASTHPLTNEFRYFTPGSNYQTTDTVDQIGYYITPKSNLVIGNYDLPAQRANITLKQILESLKKSLRLFWFIDGNKFSLEHVVYHNNGGNYIAPVIGDDLTTVVDSLSGRFWADTQNEIEFDKIEMPQRFEYSWMDNTSDSFLGFPIEMVSKFVQQEKVEDRAVNAITPDVDFIIANPSEISKDGFVLMGTIDLLGRPTLPIMQIFLVDIGFDKIQNGFMSWNFLHPEYHVFDLPTDTIIVNGFPQTSLNNVSRFKKQKDVEYPRLGNIDTSKLIKTGIGNGQVKKLSLNLVSQMIKTDLKHDTK